MRWLPAVALLALGCESTPVVLYHHVGVEKGRFVRTEDFRAQMELLAQKGYTPVTCAELDDGPLPPRPILLTFDDGFLDFRENALPVLRELGFRATLFLIADRVGDDEGTRYRDPEPYLIWPEVLAMQSEGIEFQSHTLTHPHLGKIELEVAKDEIVRSKSLLEAKLGRPVTVLAYPYGNSSPGVRGAVQDAGYRSAYSVGVGVNRRYDRLRISVGVETSLDDFERALEPTAWGDGVR